MDYSTKNFLKALAISSAAFSAVLGGVAGFVYLVVCQPQAAIILGCVGWVAFMAWLVTQ